MAVMVFLKSVADIALAFLVFGPAAVHFGAAVPSCIVTFAAISISQVLSYLVDQKKPSLRMIPYVIPLFSVLLPGRCLAWAILCGVVFAYQIFTGATHRYMAEDTAQKKIFKLTLGLIVAMLVILLIAAAKPVSYTIVILSSLISAACSILLMRSLRHEPEVYGKFSYQAVNLAVIAVVGVITAVIGSRPVLKGLGLVIKTAYTAIAYAFLFVFNYVMRFVVWLFHSLQQLFAGHPVPPQPQKPVQIDMDGAREMFPQISEYNGLPLWVKIAGLVVLIAIVAFILAMIFRKLAGGRAQALGAQAAAYSKGAEEEKKRFSGQVQGVRKQYRKYLSMIEKEGLEIEPDDTSEDICAKAPDIYGGEAARELRALYIDARYNRTASKAAAERARELVREMKKEKNTGSI